VKLDATYNNKINDEQWKTINESTS
jgi:hypothetical protein